MKKSSIFYLIGIFLVSVCIFGVIMFKFILKPSPPFSIEEIDKITITDLNGKEFKLGFFFLKDEYSYLLVADLNDCYSCIYRGIGELKTLKKAGRYCMVLVVHDSIEEVKGWSAQFEFSPFMVLNRIDFYENMKISSTPVLVKIRNGKIKNVLYILAN